MESDKPRFWSKLSSMENLIRTLTEEYSLFAVFEILIFKIAFL